MDKNTATPKAEGKSVVTRQLIICGIAIGIMGLGVWSLRGGGGPYHPADYTDDVTRSETSALMGSSSQN
ncbi:ABC-type transporter Mla subunit MlaD [Sulfitobacter undariae]|uniref:ABC-type transporter Mla subunit MlaD n=1 Tax=Sulfitobacter undariae TaxID=1563671 RepID=A0A7W6E7X8_9RHOB|nr:hypothetical protein [Sulfitobacter undariae]MBB3994287.1 ABC-type transporter Mla subunit MlaD [Sulfitobacter undariae]